MLTWHRVRSEPRWDLTTEKKIAVGPSISSLYSTGKIKKALLMRNLIDVFSYPCGKMHLYKAILFLLSISFSVDANFKHAAGVTECLNTQNIVTI